MPTVSGGDPDGRRFYNFDDPATSLLPGIRQEARCLDPSEFRDKDLELYPILEAEVGSPPSVVAAAGHTLSPHARAAHGNGRFHRIQMEPHFSYTRGNG